MAITYGDVIQCEIDSAEDSDVFWFSGSAAETIVLQVIRPFLSILRPCLELIAPDGTRTVACGNSFSQKIDTPLDLTGTYTVLVKASFFDGPYSLSLERLIPPSPNAQAMGYGDTVEDEINPAGDVDLFFFSGIAGERAILELIPPFASSLFPCLELIAPDGTRTVACGNSPSQEIDTTLNLTGTYTVLVKASVLDGGTYSLSLEKGIPPDPLPPRLSLTVEPGTIEEGQFATLSWSSVNATEVEIQPSIGKVDLQGSILVSPVVSTTYTVTGVGPGGSAQAAARLIVNPLPPDAPRVSLAVEPGTIEEGQSATLSWSSMNATEVEIQPSIGSADLQGSILVSPVVSTTYTVTGVGPGGSAQAAVRLTVTPLPPFPPPGGCYDLSGTWQGEESGSVTCTASAGGESETFTDPISGSGTIQISQSPGSCSFSYDPVTASGSIFPNGRRTGEIDQDRIVFSGLFGVLVPGATATTNILEGTGQVLDQRLVNLSGSGRFVGTAPGEGGVTVTLECTSMTTEPPRDFRRLHFLRGWGHGKTKQILTRG